MARVLMLLQERDYDPTESAVPWAALTCAGQLVDDSGANLNASLIVGP